jgi:hypothetical protein
MKNSTKYLPIGYRLFSIFLEILVLYFTIYFIIKQEYVGAILCLICFLLFIFFVILMFVHYIFTEEYICIKIPLFKDKICSINDIIGFALLSTSGNYVFIIYTKEKHFSIRVLGKNIKNEIDKFIEKNYIIVKNKNIDQLENNGINIKINKNKQFYFFIDHVEVVYKYQKDKYDYKNLKVKYLGINIINLITINNKKINFNIYQCKGNIGLFEYLQNYKWENIF